MVGTVLVSGSLAYDRIMNFPGRFRDHILPEKIHILNVSFSFESLRQNVGGTAGNIAYNLNLLGLTPVLLAQAGNDFERYKAWFEKQGIDLSSVAMVENDVTAGAYIMTDQDNNQITGFHAGAMSQPLDLLASQPFPSADWAIIAPGNRSDMIELARLYGKTGQRYIFDPGQQLPALSADELLEGISHAAIVIANDYEMNLLQEKTGASESTILETADMIITTNGEAGSTIRTKTEAIPIASAKPPKVVDPTGAGDAYRAGLVAGLMKEWPVATAGQLASTIASFAVEHAGTQEHAPSRADIQQRYQESFHSSIDL